MRAIVFGAALLALIGCAGSQTHLRILEADNALRVEPSATVPGEYVVTLRNVVDFGYDPDDPVSRTATAKQALASQCPNGSNVVGETVINTGTYGLGRPARTYSIRVKCA